MRILRILGTAVAVAVALAVFFTGLLNPPADRIVRAESATVIKDFGCRIIPPDSGLPETLFTIDKTVDVQSDSGNVTLTCRFQIPDHLMPIPATMQHGGFLCSTHWGMTHLSHAVTTKGGQVMLKCQINPSFP